MLERGITFKINSKIKEDERSVYKQSNDLNYI